MLALRTALAQLRRRQAVLRTTYHVSEDGPVQRVEDRIEELEIHDLSHLPEPDQVGTAQELAAAEAHRLFDLGKVPPWRVSLYSLDTESHLLATSHHHIATDGWSTGILWRELSELYRAALTETKPALAPLPAQYTDYARWQRERASTQDFLDSLERLRQRLDGAPPLCTFPSDRKRPSAQGHSGARLPIAVSQDLLHDLQRLARSERVTLYMLLFAAFNVLLFRYSGQTDLVIGSPVAGRTRTEFEPLIGFFVNNLVLRSDLSGDPSFLDFLKQVRGTCLDAYDTQEVPFERLVEELAPERSLTYSPVIQVGLSLHNTTGEQLELEGLTTQPLEVLSVAAKFDWWISFVQRGNRLDGVVEYNTDLYDAETVQRHCSNLTTLLESIVTDPGQRLSQLDMLAPTERHLLEEWNRTEVHWPSPLLPFQQFEKRAAGDGGRTAVSTSAHRLTLTYDQLNRQANRLAHFLIDNGVNPGTPVGVHLHRSSDALISVLAIMKSGGVYVPMDPECPEERLRYIGEMAGTRILLTSSESDADQKLPGRAIRLPAEWNQISGYPDENPGIDVSPEGPAYINFTSGSTGRPKGVVIPHAALKNLLESMHQQPGLEPADTFFSVTSLSFDISTLELLLPLVTGATVYIAPSGIARDGERLRELLEQSGATMMFSTPVGWRLLLETGWTDHSLRALTGGEELPPDLADRLHNSVAEVWNLYGPTETTVLSTVALLTPNEPVTIGRPIANTTMYVLDTGGQPVPVGATGELYIGGLGLARGYVDNPEETASRFVPNPFGPGRLYRTGDLVKWRGDGRLDFLGRNDRQVQLRGFRVEIGEVESALMLHPAVRQAAAVIWNDPTTGEDQLTAYVVGREQDPPDWQALATFVRARLPDYMVPQRWNHLEELPLTANGKVDRKRLPTPVAESAGRTDDAGATDAERRLLVVWRRVLAHENLGVLDNFFEVGGTSMLDLRLVAEVNKEFGQQLPVSTVFTAGTVSGFAAALQAGSMPRATPVFIVRDTGTRPPLFVAPGHDGDQFTLGAMVPYLNADQPVYGLEPLGLHKGSVRSVEDIASQYVAAIKAVRPTGPYLIAGYCSGSLIAWETATQLRDSGEVVPLLVLLDAASPTIPSTRPSLPARLVRKAYALRTEWDAVRRTQKGRKLGHLQNRLRRAHRRAQISLIEAFGLTADRVPTNWRMSCEESEAMREVMQLYDTVRPSYRPQTYSGRVALLAPRHLPPFANGDTPDQWRRLGNGEVTVRFIDCARLRSLSEPFVQETVHELDDLIGECLDR